MIKQIAITVDVEQDCPPFMHTYRGVEEGIPILLKLFERYSIHATFFVTGQVAAHYPELLKRIVNEGHELGSHGHAHLYFPSLDEVDAHKDISESLAILRKFGSVTSFRAPYLNFPIQFLKILKNNGILVDSSATRYKFPRGCVSAVDGLIRVPVSITSSFLRIPRLLREFFLRLLAQPVVHFVHPWEFIDLRQSSLRYDCKFNTGKKAENCLEEVILFYQKRGYRFETISGLAKSSYIK